MDAGPVRGTCSTCRASSRFSRPARYGPGDVGPAGECARSAVPGPFCLLCSLPAVSCSCPVLVLCAVRAGARAGNVPGLPCSACVPSPVASRPSCPARGGRWAPGRCGERARPTVPRPACSPPAVPCRCPVLTPCPVHAGARAGCAPGPPCPVGVPPLAALPAAFRPVRARGCQARAGCAPAPPCPAGVPSPVPSRPSRPARGGPWTPGPRGNARPVAPRPLCPLPVPRACALPGRPWTPGPRGEVRPGRPSHRAPHRPAGPAVRHPHRPPLSPEMS